MSPVERGARHRNKYCRPTAFHDCMVMGYGELTKLLVDELDLEVDVLVVLP